MWRNSLVNESHVREVRTLRINIINVVYMCSSCDHQQMEVK